VSDFCWWLNGSDPVGFGIISGLSRPAGSITGLDTLVSELAPKRLELLQEVIPHLTRIASLVDLGNCASVRAEHETEPAAKALGISLQVVSVHGPKSSKMHFGRCSNRGSMPLSSR